MWTTCGCARAWLNPYIRWLGILEPVQAGGLWQEGTKGHGAGKTCAYWEQSRMAKGSPWGQLVNRGFWLSNESHNPNLHLADRQVSVVRLHKAQRTLLWKGTCGAKSLYCCQLKALSWSGLRQWLEPVLGWTNKEMVDNTPTGPLVVSPSQIGWEK